MIDKSGTESTAQKDGSSVHPISKEVRGRQRLDILDDFRGLAIILVFLYHCENLLPSGLIQALRDPLSFLSTAFAGKVDPQAILSFTAFFPFHIGWCGVAIFFVVSGFCIHLTYCRSTPPDPFGFYVRRFFRIYPPYVLALLFFALLFPLTRLPLNKLTYWGQLLTHLFLFHNVSELSVCAISPSYWSIAVEVQLYLLFPLILLIARRYTFGRALLVLGLIEVTLHIFAAVGFERPGSFAPVWLRASPLFFCFSWSLGAALADAYLTGRTFPLARIHPVVWLIPGILTSTFPGYEFSFTCFALFTACVIARHLSRERAEEPPSYLERFVRRTGLYSYSIYLIHDPLLRALTNFVETRLPAIAGQPYLIFAIAVSSWVVIFPLGAIMYHWIEKPSVGLGKQVLRAWSQRSSRQPVPQIPSTA
jgi:peptidoglycan/LPS O-acetylase OafA/YrhL